MSDIENTYRISTHAPIKWSNDFFILSFPRNEIKTEWYDYVEYFIYDADWIFDSKYIPQEYSVKETVTSMDGRKDYQLDSYWIVVEPIIHITLGKYDFIKLNAEQDILNQLEYFIKFCKKSYKKDNVWHELYRDIDD
jgi:hypothetical protein